MMSATFCNVSIMFSMSMTLFWFVLYICQVSLATDKYNPRYWGGGTNQLPPARSWGAPQKPGPYRVNVYLKRSNSWREKGQTQLLLSHLKPHKEIQKSTLAGWVKIVLRKAGIDTSQFKAHSCRSAATSKSKAMGISLEGMSKKGQWSGESIWQKHYHKPIQSNE